MPRWNARPQPTESLELAGKLRCCPVCNGPLWAANMARRTVTTLRGLIRLRLQVRSCRDRDCSQYKVCLRPEQEGRFALPQHEFGLDVIALIGTLPTPSTAACRRSTPRWSVAACQFAREV